MELYFDTDQGRQMARKMLNAHQRIDAVMQSAQRTCDALVGVGWVSPAATQFAQALKSWISAMKPAQQLLNENKRKLEDEIAQWEEVGRSFDGAVGAAGVSVGGQASGGAHSETSDAARGVEALTPVDLEGRRGKIYDKQYGGEDSNSSPVDAKGIFAQTEGSANAAVAEASTLGKYGSAEAAALKAEASGQASVSVNAKNGLSAEASGNAGAYLGEAEASAQAGPVATSARAAVGADAHGGAGAHFGKDGASVKANAGGFAGARVDGSTAFEAGPVGAEVKGGVGAGIGGDVKADVGLNHGKVRVKLGAHGYLGIGGGGEVGFTVDVPELVDDVGDGAGWVWDKVTP